MGECVLNDAVAIALSETVENFADTHSGDEEIALGEEILSATMAFLSLFFLSLLIGFICGMVSSLVFKLMDMHVIPWIEILGPSIEVISTSHWTSATFKIDPSEEGEHESRCIR